MSLSSSTISYISSVATNLDSGTTFVIDGNKYLALGKSVKFTGIDDGGGLTIETDRCSFIDMDDQENWVYGDSHCIIHGGALINSSYEHMSCEAFNESVWELLPMLGESLLGDLVHEVVNENLTKLSNQYHSKLEFKNLPKFEYSEYLFPRNR
jgi:hypothetical protein